MSADFRFSIGDVVRLLSGGPSMTVTKFQPLDDQHEPVVRCVWFDPEDESKPHRDNFKVSTLKKMKT